MARRLSASGTPLSDRFGPAPSARPTARWRRVRSLALRWLWSACWIAGVAQAQLVDPTRPPTEFSVSEAAGAPPAAGSALQSIIMRKQGKPAALINGEVVELGGWLGEARLVRIAEDHVVLRGPLGDETLRLIPSAEKKLTKKPVPPRSAKVKKESGQ